MRLHDIGVSATPPNAGFFRNMDFGSFMAAWTVEADGRGVPQQNRNFWVHPDTIRAREGFHPVNTDPLWDANTIRDRQAENLIAEIIRTYDQLSYAGFRTERLVFQVSREEYRLLQEYPHIERANAPRYDRARGTMRVAGMTVVV